MPSSSNKAEYWWVILGGIFVSCVFPPLALIIVPAILIAIWYLVFGE